MRIAITGTQCCGKSTLINDFLKTWPMYKQAEGSGSQYLLDHGIKAHSEKSNKKTQKLLLDFLLDRGMKYSAGDKVIFDRCPLDNLVYTMWLAAHSKGKVTDDFVTETATIVRESMKFYDIIFFLPLTAHSPIELTPETDGTRSNSAEHRDEIDQLLKAVIGTYYSQRGRYFPNEDCPAVIDLVGTPEERIETIKLYVNPAGEMYGNDTPSLILPGDPSLEDFGIN
jgi:hypothetical protein